MAINKQIHLIDYISKIRVLTCILIAALFISHITHWADMTLLKRLDNVAYDFRLRLTLPNTIDPRIIILDLDEKSLASEGHWPWPRNKLSEMVDILFDHYQIKLLAFDITFPEVDTSSGIKVFEDLATHQLKNNPGYLAALNKLRPQLQYDALFAQSIKNRNIILGYYTDTHFFNVQKDTSLPKSLASTKQYPFSNSLLQANSYGANLTILQDAAKHGGYFNNTLVDEDGSYRRLPLFTVYKQQIYESLSFAIFRNLFPDQPIKFNAIDDYTGQFTSRLESIQIGNYTIPVNEQSTILVPYLGKQGSFNYISIKDVLSFNTKEEQLKDKIVILGSSAAGILDLRSTPVQHIYPGVEIHANIVSGILDQRIKYQPSFSVGIQFIFTILLCTLGIILFPKYSAGKLSAIFIILLFAISAFNMYLWTEQNIAIPLATPLIFISLLFITQITFSYLVESHNKQVLSGQFKQYIPEELVQKMLDSKQGYSMMPENKELTVLFSDVRGFTSISEKFAADELAHLINEILSPITRIIHQHGGTIDKYMGDAIMAFWGAPIPNKNHAHDALKMALEIQPTLHLLNKEFAKKGWPHIKLGVGLNTGNMNVGDMGSEFRMAYTVLGDAVNLGSRLEGLTKQYGVDIIVSEYTKKAAPDFSYKELDKVQVKGKKEPVTIFEPITLLKNTSSQQHKILKQHTQALHYYRQQNWQASKALFSEFQQHRPNELINHIYLERIAVFEQHPPEKNWDGTFEHTSK